MISSGPGAPLRRILLIDAFSSSIVNGVAAARCFLLRIMVEASNKSLLSRAGDVEPNPGPATSKCDACRATISERQSAKAVNCNQPGCIQKTHRGCRASPISRYASYPIYTCRFHRGEVAHDSDELAEIADSAKIFCLNPSCKTKVISKPPTGQKRLRCIKCGKCCHKGKVCSRMTIDEEDNWVCFLCSATMSISTMIWIPPSQKTPVA